MKNLIITTLLIAAILFAGCSNQQQQQINKLSDDTLSVATTFYPLYEATRMVTAENADIFSIVPLGSEPHSFESTPQDILKLNKAHAFVTMGIEFEAFEENLINAAESSVMIIPAGKNIALLDFEEKKHHEEEHEGHQEHSEHEEGHHDGHEEKEHENHEEEKEEEHSEHEKEHDHHDEEKEHEHHKEEGHHHGHAHHGADPHIWLSPNNMKTMVNNIKESLIQIDSKNKALYEQNAQESINQLTQLDEEYKTALASCKKATVLVNHNAFSYLAKDYDFRVIAISGLSPESEPTPQQIKELVDEAQEHGLKYVFYEELVDPRVAQTIASEVGADVLELSPVGDEGEDYFSLMRANLANLKIAMECS